MKRKDQFIAVGSGYGAQLRGCEKGPEFLREHLSGSFVSASWEFLKPTASEQKLSFPDSLPIINALNTRLAKTVQKSLNQQRFPVVLGGDHSIAVGTWSGVASTLSKPLGLIWIDAHMDAHTPYTTPSGAWHGMPLASLLGFEGLELPLHDDAVLSPVHLCLIGVRSFETKEEELLKKQGVRIFYMEEIRQKGVEVVFEKALEVVNHNTAGYGVSIDLDGIDPLEAPGVGSPVPGGLKSQDLLWMMDRIRSDSRLLALELVEFNPELDVGNKTVKVCEEILRRLT